MEPTHSIPFDILETIAATLAAGDESDTKTLEAFSQTCKSMVAPCRKHLFSSISVSGYKRTPRLRELLRMSADILIYIRRLRYLLDNCIDDEHQVLEMVKDRCCSLYSIELASGYLFDWNKLPERTKSAVVALIQLPTITHLTFERTLQNFPVTALALCTQLTHIQLRAMDPASMGKFFTQLDPTFPSGITPHFGPDHLATRRKPPAPTSLLAQTNSFISLLTLLQSPGSNKFGPYVDFSGLQKASFHTELPLDLYVIFELLKTTTQLEELSVWMPNPVLFGGLGASLGAHSHVTLRSVSFEINVAGNHYDPLCGLNHELAMIAGRNVLQEIKLLLYVLPDASCRTESDDWSAFDALLTSADAYPMLRRVNFTIQWFANYVGKEEEVMERLKEDRFPRLLESTVIEFRFTAEYVLD